MEKYTYLLKTYEALHSKDSPILISARALLKNNETGKVFVQVKFKNISDKVIKAVRVSIQAFDTFGKETESIENYQFLDLNAKTGDEFGQKNAIALSDDNTRFFNIVCKEVSFEKDEPFSFKENTSWNTVPKPTLLGEKIGDDLAEQYRRNLFPDAIHEPFASENLWTCTCGNINLIDSNVCFACHHKKDEVFSAYNIEELENHLKKHQIELAEKEAKEKQAAQKHKKIAIIIVSAISALLAIILLWSNVIKPLTIFNSAKKMMEEQNYIEAIETFQSIENYEEYKNTPEMMQECKYLNAVSFMDSEQYESAISEFKKMKDYKDSAELIEKCQEQINEGIYQSALSFIDEKNFEEALKNFKQIKNYKDSKEKINYCNEEIKNVKYQNALALLDEGKLEEALAAFNEIKQYKDSAEHIVNINNEIKYLEAISLMENKEYKKASEILSEIKDYKDSAQKLRTCKNKINSSTFSYYCFEDYGDIKSFFVSCNKCGVNFMVSVDYYFVSPGTSVKISCPNNHAGNIKV